MKASEAGEVEIVTYMLQKGATIDIKVLWDRTNRACSLNLIIRVSLNTEFNSVLKYALRMRLSPKLIGGWAGRAAQHLGTS